MRLKIGPAHEIVYQHPFWRSCAKKLSIASDLLCCIAELGASKFIEVKDWQEECSHCS